jgi:threonine dehydrogenase-like Zn-dependent dehydrogenase
LAARTLLQQTPAATYVISPKSRLYSLHIQQLKRLINREDPAHQAWGPVTSAYGQLLLRVNITTHHHTAEVNQANMAGPKLKTSIAIVGCGDVGATLAYTLILQPICSEVILVDPKKELLEAQVRDLRDATYRGGSGVKVRAGDHKDAGQADIVVITAGAKQKTGKTTYHLESVYHD